SRRGSAGRHARIVCVWIHGNRGDVWILAGNAWIRILVRMRRNRRHVIVRASALVVTQEEDGTRPLWAVHERIDDFRNLGLSGKNLLAGSRVFVIDPRTLFNECKAGKGAVREIRIILRQWRDVIWIDTERIS